MKRFNIVREDFNGVAFGWWFENRPFIFVDTFDDDTDDDWVRNEIISEIKDRIKSKKYEGGGVNCSFTFGSAGYETVNNIEVTPTLYGNRKYVIRASLFSWDIELLRYELPEKKRFRTRSLYVYCDMNELNVMKFDSDLVTIESECLEKLYFRECNLLDSVNPLIFSNLPRWLSALGVISTKFNGTDDIIEPKVFPNLKDISFERSSARSFDITRFPSLIGIDLSYTLVEELPDLGGRPLRFLSLEGAPIEVMPIEVINFISDGGRIFPIKIGSEKTKRIYLKIKSEIPESTWIWITANALESLDIETDPIISAVRICNPDKMGSIDFGNIKAEQIYIGGDNLIYLDTLVISDYVRELSLDNVIVKEFIGGKNIEVFHLCDGKCGHDGKSPLFSFDGLLSRADVKTKTSASIYVRDMIYRLVENSKRLRKIRVMTPIPIADALRLAASMKNKDFNIVGYNPTIESDGKGDYIVKLVPFQISTPSLEWVKDMVNDAEGAREIEALKSDEEKVRVMNKILKRFDPLSDEFRDIFIPREGDSERIKRIRRGILECFPVARSEEGFVF